jgi:hypothetical protein
MNRRQWKKACKKAAAECERRWPGEYVFAPADGDETVYAPPKYEPPHRRQGRWCRRFATPLKGTLLLWSTDYWGETDVEDALSTLRMRQHAEDFDWEAEIARLDAESHPPQAGEQK